MTWKIIRRDPLGAYSREDIAERCLGDEKVCVICGESRVLALERKSNPKYCTECKRKAEGKTTMDQHHIAGEANHDITMSVRSNDHRARLSEAQKDWPEETLQNRDGSPLLRGAACIRGFIDTTLYLAEELLLWNAEQLEVMDAHMVNKHGLKWWLNTSLEQFEKEKEKPNE
jgi:hypothetical protein